MSSQPSSWNNFLTKLGFGRRKYRARRTRYHHRPLRFEQCEDRMMLTVFTVNSSLDNGDGANTTLREAIEQAQNNPGPDTIVFDAAFFNEPKTILLTEGELNISESVTIEGKDPDGNLLEITIDASGGTNGVVGNYDGHSVFRIFGDAATDVEIDGLALTGADPAFGGGAIT
jgi:hypothetical protein